MGRAWVFGDNVSTDHIIPGRFNITTDPKELAQNLFRYERSDFSNAKPGDVIIAGENFGCGSSREHAAIALKEKGVYIIARSYGHIFYRNCINNGVLVLQSEEKIDVKDGEEVEVDLENYVVRSKERCWKLKKPPQFILKIVENGGLINYIKTYGGYSK